MSDELLKRADGFNPPDRTVDAERPAAQMIRDLAARVRELEAEREIFIRTENLLTDLVGRLRPDAERWRWYRKNHAEQPNGQLDQWADRNRKMGTCPSEET